MQIKLRRKDSKFNFEATNEAGHVMETDAGPAMGGEGKGFRPMELMLVGLGGCSGIDMVNILSKQKQEILGFEIDIRASRRNEEPAIFEDIDVTFHLRGNIDPQKIERAMQLTFDKYCSVAHILSKSATIRFGYELGR